MPPETSPAHGTATYATARQDTWWVQPMLMATLLTAFVVYATIRVFENAYFTADNAAAGYHYLSPFGTPDLTAFVPAFMHQVPLLGKYMSYPAFLILPFPAGFRFTCYYYRKAYYRSFVSRPANCSVEAWKGRKYRGEKGLMIINNVHRYFLYAALVVTAFLTYDAALSVFTPHGLYFGIGSLLMIANVVLLVGYTFGCHSLRHLIGGRLDCFSCTAISRSRHSMWQGVTRLNINHGTWAMASLISVALTDLYIRYVAANNITTIGGLPA